MPSNAGRPVLVGRRAMTRVGRARERGETTGFMQVLVDAETQRILGATLFGIEADEAIHCLIDAMSADLPATAIRRAVHIHPTVAELINRFEAEHLLERAGFVIESVQGGYHGEAFTSGSSVLLLVGRRRD